MMDDATDNLARCAVFRSLVREAWYYVACVVGRLHDNFPQSEQMRDARQRAQLSWYSAVVQHDQR